MKLIKPLYTACTAFILAGCTASSTFGGASAEQSGKNPAVPPLQNVYWKLTILDGAPVPALDAQREVHLVFSGNDAVHGSTGCNRLMGSYDRQDSNIHFGKIAATRRFCADTADLETAFLRMLDKVTAYERQGEQLRFTDTDGNVIAEWRAQADKNAQ
ncbi:MAG: META domain-containing protein [Gammaproteobacteria bacterium]